MLKKFALIALMALVTGCVQPEPEVATPPAPPPPPPPERLGDVDWRLSSLLGVPMPDDVMDVSFAGGFISGQAPCNTVRGNYLGTGPIFLVETLVATKIDCERLPLEIEIFDTLIDAKNAVIEDGILTINGEGGPLMQFSPIFPQPLAAAPVAEVQG